MLGRQNPQDGPGGCRPMDWEDRPPAAGRERVIPRPVRSAAGDDPAGRGPRALVRRGGGAGHVPADPDGAAQAGEGPRAGTAGGAGAAAEAGPAEGKADIDWEDAEARRQELRRLVADAER